MEIADCVNFEVVIRCNTLFAYANGHGVTHMSWPYDDDSSELYVDLRTQERVVTYYAHLLTWVERKATIKQSEHQTCSRYYNSYRILAGEGFYELECSSCG